MHISKTAIVATAVISCNVMAIRKYRRRNKQLEYTNVNLAAAVVCLSQYTDYLADKLNMSEETIIRFEDVMITVK